MANINATNSARFIAGGLATITPQGAAALIILNLAPSTLKIVPPMICEPIVWSDRSALKPPIEGADKPGSLEMTLRVSKYAGTELFTALTARKSAPDGSVRLHTIEIKIPAVRGGAAGEMLTTTTAYLLEAPSYTEGADFDTLVLKFGINDLTPATY